MDGNKDLLFGVGDDFWIWPQGDRGSGFIFAFGVKI